MNRIALALISLSSFFALIPLTAHPALANKLSPQDLALPKVTSDNMPQVNAPAAKKDSEFPSLNSTERVKQLAIQKFGCDCSSCQALASQMLLQGNLPQPQ